MNSNIVLCGVGGQGILSISIALDIAANRQGWNFKQAEVHGMSQRGGEVVSHLRYSTDPIHSEVIPRGAANLILSVEPLESLRYLEYLATDGALVSSSDPFRNIPNYPDLDGVLAAIAREPNHVLLPAEGLAREAGAIRAANMVLLGAAAPWLGVPDAVVEDAIAELFAPKGEKVQRINVTAYRAGKAAGASYAACLAGGLGSRDACALAGRVAGGVLAPGAIPAWREVFAGFHAGPVRAALAEPGGKRVQGDAAVPQSILGAGAGETVEALLFAARQSYH